EQPPTPQVPPDDSPPGSILKLNRAADTPIALDLSSDPEKQGLANRRVSINKCQHIARCSTGASITSLSDTPDRLIDHSSSMTSGNVGCAVRAGVVDNNDLYSRINGSLDAISSPIQTAEGFGDVSAFIIGWNNNRDSHDDSRLYYTIRSVAGSGKRDMAVDQD